MAEKNFGSFFCSEELFCRFPYSESYVVNVFIFEKMKPDIIRGDSYSLVFSLRVLVPGLVMSGGMAGNVTFLRAEEWLGSLKVTPSVPFVCGWALKLWIATPIF